MSGDAANTARYFINKYASQCQRLHTVRQLVGLASYAVLAGAQENPHGIGGLDVLVMQTGNAPMFLSDERIQELEKKFERTSEGIAKSLLKPFAF